MHVRALPRGLAHVLPRLLKDITLEAHLVERPLVLAGHLLHDGGQERLGVEEPGEPDGGGENEVGHPRLQLLGTGDEVGVPLR